MKLQDFSSLDIDWTLTPEDAVTMYLEWGNNNWHGPHAPVRSRDDVSVYFVVDTWGPAPVVRLVQRNSENAQELVTVPLPDELALAWQEEYGDLRGVFAPTEAISAWLKRELHHG